MNKQTTRIAGVILGFMLLTGCNQEQATPAPEATQPADTQQPAGGTTTPAPTTTTPENPAAGTPATEKPATTTPGTTTPAPGQNQPANQTPAKTTPAPAPAKPGQTAEMDLRRELIINPSLTVGKTTYDEMVKKYGKPVFEKNVKSPFRTGLAKGAENPPQIEEVVAMFQFNPLTGEKIKSVVPMFFTPDKKTLVSSSILLTRGDLREKLAGGTTITFEDVKKAYGKPNRESAEGLEYYDFQNNITMTVTKDKKGKVVARVTKYDLLYAGNPTDLQAHEDAIKELAAQK
ncbi:hypothetical protein [Brevibacillus dissolubilis]|uniref:hypothetical protein n=1 Tax=Brevibacillus dissolubilis TaxID=1844116 RepID=UPI0011176446|nr:hypothetical protein [Brevibacillus dissolubilis]